MHLQRNYVWTLDLSDRELKVVIKALRGDDLDETEQSLAEKLGDTLTENAARLDRLTAGKRRNKRG